MPLGQTDGQRAIASLADTVAQAQRQAILRIGIGGPVGLGKTALTEALCKHMRGRYDIAFRTNDIYTLEDAQFLTRSGALAAIWPWISFRS